MAPEPTLAQLGAAAAAAPSDWILADSYATALKSRLLMGKAADVYRGFLDNPAHQHLAAAALAALLTKTGRAEEALGIARGALARAPEAFELLTEACAALRKLNRVDEALSLLADFVTAHADHSPAVQAYAALLQELGQVEAARSALAAFAQRHADDYGTFINQVLTLAQLGRSEDAIQALKQRLVDEPDDWRPLTNLDGMLSALGRGQEALAAYRSYVSVHPTEWDPVNNLAALLEARGQLDGAIELCVTILDREPNHAQALTRLAGLSRKAGRFSEFGRFWQGFVTAEHAMAPASASGGPFETREIRFAPAEVAPAAAAARLASRGLILLRQAIEPAVAQVLKRAILQQPSIEQYGACELVEAVGSEDQLTAVVPDYVKELLAAIFGRAPVLSRADCYGRQVQPSNADSQVPFHQDSTAFNRVGVNFWVALDSCGVDRPGLELVAERIDRAWPTSAAYNFNEIEAADIVTAFEGRLLAPELEAGDCILFLSSTIHRSHVTPAMTAPRVSAEIRFV